VLVRTEYDDWFKNIVPLSAPTGSAYVFNISHLFSQICCAEEEVAQKLAGEGSETRARERRTSPCHQKYYHEECGSGWNRPARTRMDHLSHGVLVCRRRCRLFLASRNLWDQSTKTSNSSGGSRYNKSSC
jgi:hypothetical protein